MWFHEQVPNDPIDGFQGIAMLIGICWPMWRGLSRLNSSAMSGRGYPAIPNPYRPDTPTESIFRRVILAGVACGLIFDAVVLAVPTFPFTKERILYIWGLFIFGGLAIWHFLYLKGIVKRRTLWPGYVNQDTHENRVKEILVLRAHERGERIPTVEEVREAANMPEAEFNDWLART